jgi:two-component system LytT family response regulator
MNASTISPSVRPSPGATRYRAVIVDDEPAARRGVRLLLERDAEIEIVGEAGTGDEAAALMTRERPDVAFLDVQMPGGDGFEALARIDPARAPAVVFVTAYDEHALRAFEINAVDYLLKPFDDLRFGAALQRAKAAARRRRDETMDSRISKLMNYLEHDPARPAAGERAEAKTHDRILVKSSGEIFFLKAEEIDWIEAEGDYMKFHVAGRGHLMRETMARLEARLDGRRFIRIHRSTIVNIDRVRKLSPSFAGEYAVVLTDGTKLRLSRGYHDRVAALLKAGL